MEARVHHQDFAADAACRLAQQKHRRVGNFRGFDAAPQRRRPRPLTFDAWVRALELDGGEGTRKQDRAATPMGYARANPDTIRGRPMPVIVYDPATGREAFAVTMRKIRE